MTESFSDALKQAVSAGLEPLDAELILAYVVDNSRAHLRAWPEKKLDVDQRRQFSTLVERRNEGVPLAHLLGRKEFWSLDLRVNEDVLVPRPETEHLVECALQMVNPAKARIVDLGTGSGAIALALKTERPNWHVLAIDASEKACTVARENAKRLSVDIDVQQGSWCDDLGDASFDAVVSNPPYISEDDTHWANGSLRYEPKSALIADQDGFSDLRAIVVGAKRVLKPGGWLMLEHGYQQADALRSFMRDSGYEQVATQQDLAGLDRVTFGRSESKVRFGAKA